MEKINFELAAKDGAIIFKEDMSTELILPKISDDETVDFDENQNIFVAMAIIGAMNDADFRSLIAKKLDEMFKAIDDIEDDDKASPCSPTGCDGGCCGG